MTPDPVLAELAAAMLAQCGVRANLTLYPEFAFEKIRAECVRWMAEHSGPAAEHARAKNAGALLYRIRRNPYLPLTEAERTSRHFLEWRTEAEREADRAALVEEAAGVTGYLASDDEARAAAEARDRFKVVNIPGTKAQVHFDTLAPAAAPEWGEVMYALSLAGFEMEFRGTAAAPTADGSWIVYAPDERQAEHLRQRLTKQVQWKLVPITGRARSEIVVTFTADRAAYEAAAIVSGTVQAH